MEITTGWYLVLGALLFVIGGTGLLIRRNPLVMLMCVELMLNGVNLTFVAFAQRLNDIGGQTVVFFVLVVAAAEVVVGLGLVVAILRRQPGTTADDLSALKGRSSGRTSLADPRATPHRVSNSTSRRKSHRRATCWLGRDNGRRRIFLSSCRCSRWPLRKRRSLWRPLIRASSISVASFGLFES